MNPTDGTASGRSGIIRRIRSEILDPLAEACALARKTCRPVDCAYVESLDAVYRRSCQSFEKASRLASIETIESAWDGWAVLLDGFIRRGGKVEMTRLGKIPVLDTRAVRQIDLTVREALVNAMRHAHADRMEIIIAPWQDGFALTVTDDGRGISGQADTGVGMGSMMQRMEGAGGELLIHSGGGTTVELRIPGGFSGDAEDSGRGFASYLHDELCQELAAEAIRWEMAGFAAEDLRTKSCFDRIQCLLHKITVKARELSHELEEG